MALKTQNIYPKILDVETGFAPRQALIDPFYRGIIDYKIYKSWPKWWRKLEEFIKLDFGLAIEAKKIADDYDVVWACSELVGIPLALINVKKPLIVQSHHLFHPYRKFLLKSFDIPKKWAGIGYITDIDNERMIAELGIAKDRLYRGIKAPLDRFEPATKVIDGPIMSLGIQKRDYRTLVMALEKLPGYTTIIFATSQYGELFRGNINRNIPDWIHFMDKVPEAVITSYYELSKFVVLPLIETTHYSAGSTVALEAASAGKAIIATHTQGMPTFVINGETGILVPPYDVDAWFEAIRRLGNDPDLCHEMGLAGREFVEKKFNTAKLDQNTIEVIQKAHLSNIDKSTIATASHGGN